MKKEVKEVVHSTAKQSRQKPRKDVRQKASRQQQQQ